MAAKVAAASNVPRSGERSRKLMGVVLKQGFLNFGAMISTFVFSAVLGFFVTDLTSFFTALDMLVNTWCQVFCAREVKCL